MLTNAIFITALAIAPFVAEENGVRVTADVQGSYYVWTVENLSAEPITHFFIDAYHAFGFQVPEGWAYKGGKPEWTFDAWTEDARAAIRKGESGRFALQINNRGAGLGLGECTITNRENETIVFSNMWRPVPENTRSVYLIPLTLCALALLHTLVIQRRIIHPIDDT